MRTLFSSSPLIPMAMTVAMVLLLALAACISHPPSRTAATRRTSTDWLQRQENLLQQQYRQRQWLTRPPFGP